MYKYLSDKDFLKEVDCAKLKTLYIKLTALDWNENPIQDIQSSVVSGTLNIDGKSSIRRTCSLSIITNNVNVTDLDNLFSLNKKVKLEIGYKNIFNKYPEYQILWFPQGIFVITSASISQTTNGTTLGLQLKDKMCLLNGECGGVISYPTEIDVYDDVDENGKLVTKKIPMYKLIQEVVNHYGKEPLHKILVSDIDTRVKKVLSWYGDTPLYGEVEEGKKTVSNFTTIKPTENYYFLYKSGDDIGYAYEDFYYPDTLNVNAGDNVCTILDKIKNALGNFEYFYDVEGNFIFREIKNYLNTSKVTSEIKEGKWKINIDNENYLMNASNSKSVYDFNDTNIIVSCANNPQYNMIKNDFIVCGQRKGLTGEKIPIFYHLAIDKKPETGVTFKGFEYEDPDDGLVKFICPVEYNTLPIRGEQGLYYKLKDNDKVYIWDLVDKETNPHYDYKEIDVNLTTLTSHDWRTTLYLQGSQSTKAGLPANDYYEELRNEWPKVYDVMEGDYSIDIRNLNKLNFFLDFLDMNTNIAKFSISNIGKRSKVINDNKINCLFEQDIPDLFVIESGTPQTEYNRQECIQKKNDYVQVSQELYSNISNGGKMNSAFNLVQELLYQYTDYNESVSLQTLPILYLEPNSRVSLNNTAINLSGDYVINSLSIPLSVGGTMTISATKMIGPLEGTIVTDKPKPAPPEPIPPDPTPPPEPTPPVPRRDAGFYDLDGNLLRTLTLEETGTNIDYRFEILVQGENYFDGIPYEVVFPEGVIEISDLNQPQYEEFGNLVTVDIPKTVKIIRSFAFLGNKTIENIIFEKDSLLEKIDEQAFYNCKKLSKINIEDLPVLKSIKHNAFDGCYGLINIKLPDSLEELSYSVFKNCINLEELILNDNLKTLGSTIIENTKVKSITIPGGIENLPYDTFYYSNVEEVIFSEGITSLPNSILFSKSSLKKVVFPSTLETIPQHCVEGCYHLQEVIIKEGTKFIGEYCFDDCWALNTITLPSSVIAIKQSAFYNCTNLKNIILSENLLEIGYYAFYSCINLEEIIFPSSLLVIMDYAFCNCPKLTNLAIPEQITTIGSSAFNGCRNLDCTIQIPNSIKAIYRYTFAGCEKLKVILPDTVQVVEDSAFGGIACLEYYGSLSGAPWGATKWIKN